MMDASGETGGAVNRDHGAMLPGRPWLGGPAAIRKAHHKVYRWTGCIREQLLAEFGVKLTEALRSFQLRILLPCQSSPFSDGAVAIAYSV